MPTLREALEGFIQNVRSFGLEYFGRYYSSYRGIVIDNKDPNKEGRIIATVPMITGNEPLPDWCYPKASVGGAKFGIFHPPDIGSGVWIEFENGDILNPIYSGGWWATLEEGGLELPADLQKDPPTAYGWYTSTGHHLFFETEAGKEQVRLGWKNGDGKLAYISMTDDGSIQAQAADGTLLKLDASKGAVTILDKNKNLIATSEASVSVVHNKGALVELKDGVATVMAKEVVLSGEGLNASVGGCTLGQGAQEPLVLGNKLLALWTQAMAIFAAHLHPTTAPGAPTGPPTGAPWPTYDATINSLKNKGA